MLKITISRKGLNLKGWRMRFRRIIREEVVRVLKMWRSGTLPKHFKARAGNIYKYHPRKKKYTDRQRKKYGQYQPMVFTGKSRERMIRDQREPTGRGGKMSLHLPADKQFHIKYPGWPHRMRDEVTEITRQEIELLRKTLQENVVRRINAEQDTEKLTI